MDADRPRSDLRALSRGANTLILRIGGESFVVHRSRFVPGFVPAETVRFALCGASGPAIVVTQNLDFHECTCPEFLGDGRMDCAHIHALVEVGLLTPIGVHWSIADATA